MPLINPRDLFDRVQDAKRMKVKCSKQNFLVCSILVTNINLRNKKIQQNAPEVFGLFQKLFNSRGLQNYPIISKTNAATAERTTRSLKILFYRFVKVFAFGDVQKLAQIVEALTFKGDCSRDVKPNIVRMFFDGQEYCSRDKNILCILYSKYPQDNRQPLLGIGTKTVGIYIKENPLGSTTVYAWSCCNCCICFQTPVNVHKKAGTGWDCTLQNFGENVDQSHLTMDSFTEESDA